MKTGDVAGGQGRDRDEPGRARRVAHGAEGVGVADMAGRGVEQTSYFQVDNPIVRVGTTVLGLHAACADSSGEMSSKMLAKAYPEEKLGMFCVADGKLQVIEYSDLPMERQRERLPDGRPAVGSPAIHAMSVAFVEKVTGDSGFALRITGRRRRCLALIRRRARRSSLMLPMG